MNVKRDQEMEKSKLDVSTEWKLLRRMEKVKTSKGLGKKFNKECNKAVKREKKHYNTFVKNQRHKQTQKTRNVFQKVSEFRKKF